MYRFGSSQTVLQHCQQYRHSKISALRGGLAMPEQCRAPVTQAATLSVLECWCLLQGESIWKLSGTHRFEFLGAHDAESS